MKTVLFVLALAAPCILGGGCGSKPLSCSDAIDKLAMFCNYSDTQKAGASLGFCDGCSTDGSARWSACVTDAKSCSDAKACKCSLD